MTGKTKVDTVNMGKEESATGSAAGREEGGGAVDGTRKMGE